MDTQYVDADLLMPPLSAMKFQKQVVALLTLCFHTGYGRQCGTAFTSACVGDTDKRYNPKASNDLVAQAPIWGQLHGYWINSFLLDIDPVTGGERQPGFYNPQVPQTLDSPYILKYGFYNETFIGSRYYSNRYYVHAPPPTSGNGTGFCDLTVPQGFDNVVAPGACGVNGLAEAAGVYGTSTYEKDGVIDRFWSTGKYQSASGLISRLQPVDDMTFFGAASIPGVFLVSDSYVFLRNYSEISGTQNFFRFYTPIGSPLQGSHVFLMKKVSESEWVAAIDKAYTDFNILPEQRVQNGTLPMRTDCVTENDCPNETDWCKIDPDCSKSPYQEPSATIKAGPIVGIVLAAVVVLFALFYGYYRYQLYKQEKRIRKQFAMRIAEHTMVRASVNLLSPEALGSEFRKVAYSVEDSNGQITKEALWEFISSGKAGEMDEKDFNALFAAIDVKGDGKVDFLDFCRYMSICGEDVLTARKELKAMQKTVEASARRISMVVSGSQALVPEAEPEAEPESPKPE